MEMPPVVQLQDVKKRLGRFCLDIQEMEIRSGEFFTIVGPSGSGKTTLLNLLAGFSLPDQGTIRVNGVSPHKLVGSRRIIRTLFQDLALFPHLTVAQQLALAAASSTKATADLKALISAWLDRLQLEPKRHLYPHQLSGGQRQRLALGRAMIGEPQIIILDEPMTALDYGLRADLWSWVERVAESYPATFIVVTHDPDIALSRSTRIAVIDDGRCVQVGSPEEIYSTPKSEDIARLLGSANIIQVNSRTLVVRPEKVVLSADPIDSVDFCEQARILRRVYKGSSVEYSLFWKNQLLSARDPFGSSSVTYVESQAVHFGWRQSHVTFLN